MTTIVTRAPTFLLTSFCQTLLSKPVEASRRFGCCRGGRGIAASKWGLTGARRRGNASMFGGLESNKPTRQITDLIRLGQIRGVRQGAISEPIEYLPRH